MGDNMKVCSFEDCGAKVGAYGLCAGHYRQKRVGTPLKAILRSSTEEEYFEHRVSRGPDCWEWNGPRTVNGYATMRFGGRSAKPQLVHRFAYEMTGQKIPEGKLIDHVCGNKGCVNPGHLRVVDEKQNMENLYSLASANKSGYRGVSFSKQRQLWQATVIHNGKGIRCGFFATPEAAGEAARELRVELYTHNELDRV